MDLPIEFEDDQDFIILSEEEINTIDRTDKHPPKRQKSNPAGDQTKQIQLLTREFGDSQRKKIDLLERIVSAPQQNELELFFASICKTVEKLTAIDQVKIKMKVTQIVHDIELARLQTYSILESTQTIPTSQFLSQFQPETMGNSNIEIYSSESLSSEISYNQNFPLNSDRENIDLC